MVLNAAQEFFVSTIQVGYIASVATEGTVLDDGPTSKSFN